MVAKRYEGGRGGLDRKKKEEDQGIALAASEARRAWGEWLRLRAHRVDARRGVPKGDGECSLGEVGGEEGGWCVDAGEGAGGKGEAGRLRLRLSLRRGKKKKNEREKRRERKGIRVFLSIF